MHPLVSKAFEQFWAELNRLGRSQPIQNLKKETAVRILDYARSVPTIFSPVISVKKGKEATLKGAVTLAIAALVYSTARGLLQPVLADIGIQITPEQEKTIVGFLALVVGSLTNGVLAWYANRKKHRDDI